MFKPSIVITISLLSLSGIVYGQEKKERSDIKDLSVPAFLMPATVARTTASPPEIADNPSAPAAEISSTHSLQYHDPESGATGAFRTTKPIQVVGGEKNKDQPAAEAREKKSNLK